MQRRCLCRLTIAIAFALMLTPTTTALSASSAADEYRDFGRYVAQVIGKMKEVAVGNRERSDLRALEFLLRNYNQAVSAGDLRQADRVKQKMRVYLIRGGVVASDAARRKADRVRADAERRHREEMRQRERQHQEAMKKQQELINRIRINQYSPYWRYGPSPIHWRYNPYSP